MEYVTILVFSHSILLLTLSNMASRKEPVHLREKPLSSGRSSLYLEINKDGMRRYEFLKLYITNGKSKTDKQADKKTWELAEAIRAKRVVELRNSRYGFTDYDNGKSDVIAYIRVLAQKKNKARKYALERVADILVEFANRERLEFNYIDKVFIENFLAFLKTRYKSQKHGRQIVKVPQHLSNNSIYEIFSILSAVMNTAVKNGIVPQNPLKMLDSSLKPKLAESKREFLTLEELKKLIETDCPKYTKTIFLFACYTGLRHSDIVSLKWEDIEETDNGLMIRKKQQKTRNLVEIPLNEAALNLLPERKGSGLVFNGKSHNVVNVDLKKWGKKAGLNKTLTFHVSRHTFATLLISKGADLYVVSKLLGHSRITTTQTYAKVVDKSRKDAVNLLPDFTATIEQNKE